MSGRFPNLKLFSGRSNMDLSLAIEAYDGLKLSDVEYFDFANGEMKVQIGDTVRGEDVFLIQTSAPDDPNKWMMELLMMAHTAKLASARRVTAVMPYIYGCRQDRKTDSRTPITIQLIGDLLRAAGVDRIVTMTLHNDASVGSFHDILVDNLSAVPVFLPVLQKVYDKEGGFVVLSPDAGGVERAKTFASYFNAELGFAYKMRPKDNEASVFSFVGDVKDKNILIIDDMVDTAGTLCKVIEAAKERGAKKVFVCATHPIFSNGARKRIEASPIDKMFITNSITHKDLPENIEVVNIGDYLGEVILRVSEDRSVGELFETMNYRREF